MRIFSNRRGSAKKVMASKKRISEEIKSGVRRRVLLVHFLAVVCVLYVLFERWFGSVGGTMALF